MRGDDPRETKYQMDEQNGTIKTREPKKQSIKKVNGNVLVKITGGKDPRKSTKRLNRMNY